MTLRTSLVIDGDASGAKQATDQTAAGLGQVEAAAERAAREAAQAMARIQQQTVRQAAQLRQQVLFQLNDIGVSLASGMNPLMVAIQQGSQLATGPGGLAAALKETGNIAAGLVTKFAPIGATIGVITAGIAGMQNAINSAGSSVQVSFGDTALGLLQTLGDYIWEGIGPAITGIGQWFADAWNASWPTIKTFGNMLAGTFAGAFDAMKSIWSTLPDVMGDIVFSAAQAVIDGIKWLINVAIDRFNDLRHLAGMDKKDDLKGLGPDLFKIDNPYAGAAGKAGAAIADSFSKAYGTDYLGGFFNDVAAKARENAMNRMSHDAAGAKSKQQAAAVEDVTRAVEKQRTAWDELADIGGNAFDRLTDTILSGGKDILSTIQSIAADFAKMAFQMSVTNPLKNALFGGDAVTFGSSILSSFLGGAGSTAALATTGLRGRLSSYAGGGYTGGGARAGGLDGMGGFLAMMHPQESVIDHAAGGSRAGSPEVIKIVLQDDSGRMAAIADRRIQTATGPIIQLSTARASRAVKDDMARGGYSSLGITPPTRSTS